MSSHDKLILPDLPTLTPEQVDTIHRLDQTIEGIRNGKIKTVALIAGTATDMTYHLSGKNMVGLFVTVHQMASKILEILAGPQQPVKVTQ